MKTTLKTYLGVCLLTAFVFILGLSVGSSILSPAEVLKALFGGENSFVISTLRLPRLLVAFFVGAALSVAGAILQSLIRNPLASPDIIGITGGAKVAAVLYLTFFAAADRRFLPLAAIAGAVVATLLIYLLAFKKGVSPIRLVLIGIGLNAGMGALVTMLIVISPTYSTSDAYIWLTGSVYGANWSHVRSLVPWLAVFLPIAFLCARRIDIQELGDDLARGVGARVESDRLLLIAVSVALAGIGVAFAGGIGFVGLIAPHLGRQLVGRSFKHLAPIAALIGGTLVMSADIIARTLFLPLDLPAGVFVSAIGAPFFIYLLYKGRNS